MRLLTVLFLILDLHIIYSRAEYIYENGQWIWKDDATPSVDKTESYNGGGGVDGDTEGSAEYYDNEEDDYSYEGSAAGGEEYDENYDYDSYPSEKENNWNTKQQPVNNVNTNNKNKNSNNDKNNNDWGSADINNNFNYNQNNDEDIQLTDDTKAPAIVTPPTTPRSPNPTTPVVKLTTRPIVVGNTNIHPTSFFAQPGILAAVVGGAVVGLLCAILLVMFIVYRMRKKDEGSYSLDEPRRSPNAAHLYAKANSREFFA